MGFELRFLVFSNSKIKMIWRVRTGIGFWAGRIMLRGNGLWARFFGVVVWGRRPGVWGFYCAVLSRGGRFRAVYRFWASFGEVGKVGGGKVTVYRARIARKNQCETRG